MPTRLDLAPRALADLERLAEFLLESDIHAAAQTTRILIQGLQILKDHPLMGRKVELNFREVLISRGRTGYVALYKYCVESDAVTIYAIRHQREGNFLD